MWVDRSASEEALRNIRSPRGGAAQYTLEIVSREPIYDHHHRADLKRRRRRRRTSQRCHLAWTHPQNSVVATQLKPLTPSLFTQTTHASLGFLTIRVEEEASFHTCTLRSQKRRLLRPPYHIPSYSNMAIKLFQKKNTTTSGVPCFQMNPRSYCIRTCARAQNRSRALCGSRERERVGLLLDYHPRAECNRHSRLHVFAADFANTVSEVKKPTPTVTVRIRNCIRRTPDRLHKTRRGKKARGGSESHSSFPSQSAASAVQPVQ